jgi:uncharacterized membrane protein
MGTAENTFKLEVPALATTIHQGEAKEVKVSISRGKNFSQDVKLTFSGAPTGVKVTPEADEIKAGATDVKVKVEAAKDAALGEHTIKVTGKPKEGAETSLDLKIDVKKPG